MSGTVPAAAVERLSFHALAGASSESARVRERASEGGREGEGKSEVHTINTTRERARDSVCVRARACVRSCVRACVCLCVGVWVYRVGGCGWGVRYGWVGCGGTQIFVLSHPLPSIHPFLSPISPPSFSFYSFLTVPALPHSPPTHTHTHSPALSPYSLSPALFPLSRELRRA